MTAETKRAMRYYRAALSAAVLLLLLFTGGKTEYLAPFGVVLILCMSAGLAFLKNTRLLTLPFLLICLLLIFCYDSFNVFIYADDIHRAARVTELTGITNPSELQKAMAKKDSSRRNYYTHYTGQKWGDSRNYHLSVDSGLLGADLCVKLIVDAVKNLPD